MVEGLIQIQFGADWICSGTKLVVFDPRNVKNIVGERKEYPLVTYK